MAPSAAPRHAPVPVTEFLELAAAAAVFGFSLGFILVLAWKRVTGGERR